jgi:hypothetical protein
VAQTARDWADGPVFRGVTHLALDTKGRLAIPAKHREAIARRGLAEDEDDKAAGSALILTADPSGVCCCIRGRRGSRSRHA